MTATEATDDEIESELPEEHTIAYYLVQDLIPWREELGSISGTDRQEEIFEELKEAEMLDQNISQFSDDMEVDTTYVRELLLRVKPHDLKDHTKTVQFIDRISELCEKYPIHIDGFDCQNCDDTFYDRKQAVEHQMDTGHEVQRN